MSNPNFPNILIHHGVKGMRWGVRKDGKNRYADRALVETPGSITTRVMSKTGDKLTIEKSKLGPLAVAVAKLTGKSPEQNLSTMVIRNAKGDKVGSFQVWPDKKDSMEVVRGEWLEIDSKYQGRGYSEAAIRGLIKSAQSNSEIKEVRLQVPSDAAPAKHIYSKIGFSKDYSYGDSPIYGELEDWVYKMKR